MTADALRLLKSRELSAFGRRWSAELAAAIDMTRYVGHRTSAFGLGTATRSPVDAGGGAALQVAQGAAVNCQHVVFNPHAHCTHIETLAHVTVDGPDVADLQLPGWMLAVLVTVPTARLVETGERGPQTASDADQVIPAAPIRAALTQWREVQALIVRPAPSVADVEDYSATNPPYFTTEAIAEIARSELRHLCVELPSIDREQDGGTTPNHRIWWGLADNARRAGDAKWPSRTITELLRVPARLPDGPGLLALQVAPFTGDAAPCRVLFAPLRLLE